MYNPYTRVQYNTPTHTIANRTRPMLDDAQTPTSQPEYPYPSVLQEEEETGIALDFPDLSDPDQRAGLLRSSPEVISCKTSTRTVEIETDDGGESTNPPRKYRTALINYVKSVLPTEKSWRYAWNNNPVLGQAEYYLTKSEDLVFDGHGERYAVVATDLAISVVSTEDEALQIQQANPDVFIQRIGFPVPDKFTAPVNIQSGLGTIDYSMFRSVAIDPDSGRYLGVSPPKSDPYDEFTKRNCPYGEIQYPIIAQELVEGTMINLFFDPRLDEWVPFTKSKLGANTSFYKFNGAFNPETGVSEKTKSFRTMFDETCAASRLSLDRLDKTRSYSFVMQHPENKIVVPFQTPTLYLIAEYTYSGGNRVAALDIYKSSILSDTCVRTPKRYPEKTCVELMMAYASHIQPPATDYTILGFVLYHVGTGRWTKLRNPAYEVVRRLRGNQPKIQHHYLTLLKTHKLDQFIEYYPEYAPLFTQFCKQVVLFVNKLYSNYVNCFILKTAQMKDTDVRYKATLYALHNEYTWSLRPIRASVTKQFVRRFVSNMPESQLMYYLNIHHRDADKAKKHKPAKAKATAGAGAVDPE